MRPDYVGPLVILETLGEGRFGRVYRARDPHLQRDVALKVLHPRDRQSGGGSLVTEARLLARVRHPNVVTIHGADIIDGEIGLWMELVEGRTLASWVATHGPLGAEEAAVIGATLCRSVAAVHQGRPAPPRHQGAKRRSRTGRPGRADGLRRGLGPA
jgi:serine/threonine protein kinase